MDDKILRKIYNPEADAGIGYAGLLDIFAGHPEYEPVVYMDGDTMVERNGRSNIEIEMKYIIDGYEIVFEVADI